MKNYLPVLLLLFSITCYSFENSGRFGLGATSQTYEQLPAVSLKVHFSEKTAIGTYFSYKGTEEANYNFGFRYYNSIVSEPNLIFYGVLSGGILQTYNGTTSSSGYEGSIHFGTEFFFEEIKHIGLSFEAGISMTNVDEFIFQTSASHLFNSAIHFYF
jgi:hypothetical protein